VCLDRRRLSRGDSIGKQTATAESDASAAMLRDAYMVRLPSSAHQLTSPMAGSAFDRIRGAEVGCASKQTGAGLRGC